MSKSSILKKNKKTVTPVPERHEKIYQYLRKAREPKSLTQISKAIEVPRATARRILEKLIGNNKYYELGGNYYTIVYQEKGYSITKKPKHVTHKNYYEYIDEKEKNFEELRSSYITELIEKRVTTSSRPEEISKTVIVYDITKNSRPVLEKMIRSLFNEKIYDVVPCERGLYIIFQEFDDLDYAKKQIFNFYIDLAKSRKTLRKAHQGPRKTKKETC